MIEGKAESLLGQDSSFKFKNHALVNSVGQTSEVDSLLQEYDDVFWGVGRVTNLEQKITIDLKVKPVRQHLGHITVSQIEEMNLTGC